MIRVGVVGLRRGSSFFTFNLFPDTQVTAVCDIDQETLRRAAKEHGVEKAFTRYEEMLQADLDVVVVATPLFLHAQQAVEALEAGMHVLSEVTAAASMEECYRLVDAVERSGCKYMMAENYCYIKENVLLKQLIAAGKLGELYFGEGEYVHDCKSLMYNPDGSLTWRGWMVTYLNGNLYPTHSLGPLYQMFGERVATVSCLGSGVHTIPGARGEDSVITLCKTVSGKLLKLRYDIVSYRPHNMRYYALQGTRGCYVAPRGLGDDHKIWLMDDCPDPQAWKPLKEYDDEYLPEEWKHPPQEALKTGHWGADYFIVKDFLDAIVHDNKPPIDVYDAMNITAPGLASQESIAKGGAPVQVPDFKNR